MTALSQTTTREVFDRDGRKCRHCGWTDGLHPHHIVYRSQMGSDRLDNLITLCWQCHRALHDGFLKLEVLEVLQFDIKVRFTRRKGWKPV
jgi:5-methylcytosine-specific restriction endonuclease McrA